MERRNSYQLIPEIYEATVDQHHWDHVLAILAKISDSSASCLIFNDLNNRFSDCYNVSGLSQALSSDMESFFKNPDCLFNLDEDVTDTTFFHSSSQSDINELVDTPGCSIRTLLQKANIDRVAGTQFKSKMKQHITVMLLKNAPSQAWSDDQLKVIDDIMPHLKRAFNIHSEFSRLRYEYDALQKGLDRLVIGLVLFDSKGRPVYVNPTAQNIIDAHPALQANKVGLFVHDQDQNNQLQKTISEVALVDPDDSWRQAQAIGITHPDKKAPLPILVTPMHAHQLTSDLEGYQGAKVAVFISDPNQEQPISADSLIRVYGLSQSEAQVAIGIANGQSIEEIAKINHKSVHTIRTQLKAVFNKVGVSRQSELIKLLLTGPFAQRTYSTKN